MNKQEKSLKLAELMGWEALQPYDNTPNGLAQFAAILLKFPEVLQRKAGLHTTWKNGWKPTQENILNEVLRMNGIELEGIKEENRKMKLKNEQRVEYRNGKIGIILSTERPYFNHPIVSMDEGGTIWTHREDGKLCAGESSNYDIVPPVPQGKDLCGILCGVSDCSLETAKSYAEKQTILRIIDDYGSDYESMYRDNTGTLWSFAWPVYKQDIEPCLLDEEEMKNG